MVQPNYYDVLGITRTASTTDIKKAYRTLCLKWHPDKAPKNNKNKKDEYEKKFKILTEAHDTLVDTKKRQIYDNPLDDSGYHYENSKKDFTFGAEMDNIFSTFFGDMSDGNFKSSHTTSSFSKTSSKNRNFDEKAFEKAFDIPFFRNNTSGQFVKTQINGYNDDTHEFTNSYCDKGSDISPKNTYFPKSNNSRHTITCTLMDLVGNKNLKYSYTRKICKGTRLVNNKETIDVIIPPNHDISKPIIIENMGSVHDKNFAPGDLELSINISPYKNFKLDGNQLVLTLNIDLKKAINGFIKTVSCLDGEKIKIKVNPLETSGDIITLKGKGICGGDMIIKFDVNFAIFYNNDTNDSIEKLKTNLKGYKEKIVF